MISFVVQNFYSTPFLPKTQRYNKLVIAMNTKLLFIFLKLNVQNDAGKASTVSNFPVYMYLLDRFFRRNLYGIFKAVYTQKFGIMSLNLTKSCMFKVFYNLNLLLKMDYTGALPTHQKYSIHNVKYLQPVTIVSFAFHKSTYNTLMIYIISLLPNWYTPNQNTFKLYYGFVLYTSNLSLYPFLNHFYFKLRQF